MPKRKRDDAIDNTRKGVTFAPDVKEREDVIGGLGGTPSEMLRSNEVFMFGQKEDMGSDDDDDEDDDEDGNKGGKKYDVLNEDDIEGQEAGTVDFDGDIRITPFNMQEEMEEGHFDTEGTYIWKEKDKDEIKDAWLDNVDWVKVKHVSKEEEQNVTDEDESGFDSRAAYQEMLQLMKPGETVTKALRRLGGGKTQTASERWKKKKQGEDVTKNNNKEEMLKLTGLADQVLSNLGNMDIYQETFEGIQHKLKSMEKSKTKTEKDVTDMFGETFDEPKKPRVDDNTASDMFSDSFTADPIAKPDTDKVMWMYKKENSDAAEIHGPFDSTQMLQWSEEGTFGSGVWVRKVGQEGEFYSSARIDFEIYT